MHMHVCILLKPFCLNSISSSVLKAPAVKRHLAYSKHFASSVNLADMDEQLEHVFVQVNPELVDEFGVYHLEGSHHCLTAETLVTPLLHMGILGLPIRSGLHT